LRELTPAQSRRLVDSLLHIEDFPASVRELILAKAQGNPYFVEEVVRSLIDSGMVVVDEASGRWQARPGLEAVQVPESIQSVILSRVDRLEEGVRHTLQSASVIGRLFRRRLLERLADQETAIDRALWELEDRALIYEERVIPEEEYSFQHVLTQETVYHNILRQRRAAFHQKVAEAIETLYKDNLEEFYEQLAHHYTQSGAAARAITYLVKAGDKARDRYANQEALGDYTKALELAGDSDASGSILARRGQLLADLFRGREAARDFEALLERARRRGDRQQELEALLGLARASYYLGLDEHEADHVSAAREQCEAAYGLARQLGDHRSMVRALLNTKWFHDFWPDYRSQQEASAAEAVALSREIGDAELSLASRMYRWRYLPRAEAEAEAEELVRLLKERHDLLRLNELYFGLMWAHRNWGHFEQAAATCDAGIALAQEIGVPPVQYPTLKALALLALGRNGEAWDALRHEVADAEHPFGQAMQAWGTGIYYATLLSFERAAEVYRAVIEQAKRLRRVWMRRTAQTLLATALLRAGRLDAATRQAITRDLETMGAALPAAVLAELALSEGRPDEALARAEEAASEAGALGHTPDQVVALELQVRSLLRLDKPEDALALAGEALRLAEALRFLPLVWRLRGGRAQALAKLGKTEAAAQEYGAAAAVIQTLAGTIGEATLRDGFLSNDAVSSILAAANGPADSGAAGQ
jgi:tetratricopeptide (TPR) repeat protein